MRKICLILAAGCIVCPFVANADVIVIDFEGVVPDGSFEVTPILPYSEDGFELTTDDPITNGIYAPGSVWNTNGTDVLGLGDLKTVVISTSDGSLFSLLGFESSHVLGGFTDDAVIEVAGFFGAGGSIFAEVGSASDSFIDHTFDSAWSGLSSVTLTPRGLNGAIDNITVRVPGITMGVPEPGTLALLGVGLFGMGLARRRNPAQEATIPTEKAEL